MELVNYAVFCLQNFIVLTPDMPILCRHVQVYTLGRLSIDGFSFERVAQFNLEWIFSKLDSGFQSLVGFRILSSVFQIPKPRIPDSTSKKFLDSGIRSPLHGAIRVCLPLKRKTRPLCHCFVISGFLARPILPINRS